MSRRAHSPRWVAVTVALIACADTPIAPPVVPPDIPMEIAVIGNGDGQQGVEGIALPLPLQVRVTQGGLPLAGIPVVWTTSSGSLTTSGSFTSHLGIATMRWTPRAMNGDSAATATAALYQAPDRQARFHATIWPRVEAREDNDELAGGVGTVLPSPVRVRLTRGGHPAVEGIPVDWTTSSGSASPSRSYTDHDGVASTSWRLGTFAGTQQIRAAARGHLEGPVVITATALPGPASIIQLLGSYGPRPANFRAIADTLKAMVTDQYANPLAGQRVSWHLVSGSAELAPIEATTDSAGMVRARLYPLGVDEPVVVRASVDGSPAAVTELTFTFTAPEYVVHLVYTSFVSPMNGTSPAVDTIPVSATLRWVLWPFDYDDHAVESVGTPSFAGGAFPYASPSVVAATFTSAGTYRYHDPWTGGTGTVVVVP